MEIIDDKKEKNKIAGLILVGCMFVGIAVGMYQHATTVGTLAGLGVGFLISAVYRMRK